MGWRTIILTKEAKLSLRMNHLVVKGDETATIPLEEINSIIIENPSIALTGHLMNALTTAKIHVVLCDQVHLPITTVQSIYGHHRQAKHIAQQIAWLDERKAELWQILIVHKLQNQAALLRYLHLEGYQKIDELISNVTLNDETNREGHGAKIYFHQLFGHHFIRGYGDGINAGLNYGYTLLHSLFARLIVSKGYLTELGIFHKNEYNSFNFASDLMEIFRPLVDYTVYNLKIDFFTKEERRALIQLLECKVEIRGSLYYLTQAVQIFLDGCIHFLNTGSKEKMYFPRLHYTQGK